MKKYIIIAIVVIVIAGIAYYFWNKNKKKSENKKIEDKADASSKVLPDGTGKVVNPNNSNLQS